MPFVWGNHGKVLDKKGNMVFDSPNTREAFDFYLRLQEFSYKEKQDMLDNAFKNGKLGMTISGSWNIARYPKDAPDLQFSTALIPAPDGGKGFSSSFYGGEILVLFKTCKNPDMASKFVRFLTKMENTMPITKEALVSFPAHKAIYNNPFFTESKYLAVFLEQMKTAVHPPIHPLWIELEKIVNRVVEGAMYGKNLDKLFADGKEEFVRVTKLREARLRRKIGVDSDQNSSVKSSPQSSNLQLLLLLIIAAGTLINAVLLSFVIGELKKKLD